MLTILSRRILSVDVILSLRRFVTRRPILRSGSPTSRICVVTDIIAAPE